MLQSSITSLLEEPMLHYDLLSYQLGIILYDYAMFNTFLLIFRAYEWPPWSTWPSTPERNDEKTRLLLRVARVIGICPISWGLSKKQYT